MNIATGPAMLPANDRADTLEGRFSDKAYSMLLDRLVRLHYQPLQPLNERELTIELKIGLAPIREALRRLQGEHLVVIYPRRGIFAAEIGLRDQQSIKEIRLEIESLAASLAALRATPQERQALAEFTEALCGESDISRQIAGDAEVHRRIYKMARNEYLEAMLTLNFNLALRLWYFCNQSAPPSTPQPVDHRLLAQAIVSGDSESARTLMRDHVSRDSDRVRDLLFKSAG
ncbi:GntR family transcriptional regulator [Mesorhizobium sp. B2-4-19]|uniref:GntR family transcriptional regulator n=1 Tax=Mesorhizobium sp. B2-4-19 TaxID=2589930 RepID=UPI00112BED50|nr:GntR family transcriptional regulator [Mesorhizobium sp. B2-4-19]TPK60069.1 GntR family transcriptional regulator [Mesorhizobium sp. B2-4-19]